MDKQTTQNDEHELPTDTTETSSSISSYPSGEKPEIVLAGEFFGQVDDAIDALNRDKIFNQSGFLVRVVNMTSNSVVIREHTSISICDSLSRSANWRKWKKSGKDFELVPADGPTEKICKAVVARGEYPGISIIRGITESPFLRKDGSICYRNGFDHESGFYLNLSTRIKKIPDHPTQQQAADAYNSLVEPFLEFPFIDEKSRAVPVAAILSVIARPMLGNVPAFVLDASTRGSGKTLISDVISIILKGKPAPKLTWPVGREYNVELEKTMNSAAMMGSPLICFDNIPSTAYYGFGGPIIEKFITSNGVVSFRKLGGNVNYDMDFNGTIIATGNNLLDGIQDETRRRVLPCRMVPDCEHPENRTGFKHNPLAAYIEKNRSAFLESALTVLRFALSSGRVSEPWGSFEEFADLIPPAITLAGGPDIMANKMLVPASGGEDNEAFIGLLQTLGNKFVLGFTAKDALDRAKSDDELSGAMESMFYGAVPNSRKLGACLRSRKDRIHSGMKIVEAGRRNNSVVWNIAGDIKQMEQTNLYDNEDMDF